MEKIDNIAIKKLINGKYIRNSNRGFVDRNGETVGFYRTKNKRYIEDKFAELAKQLP